VAHLSLEREIAKVEVVLDMMYTVWEPIQVEKLERNLKNEK